MSGNSWLSLLALRAARYRSRDAAGVSIFESCPSPTLQSRFEGERTTTTMTYEVELKFHLRDARQMLTRLDALGAVRGVVQTQCDQYFAHPVRDFATTDEALRIRSIGDENRITFKGPVIDKATKTRHESELTFQSGTAAAEQLAQIWEQLGFRRVRQVKKSRQLLHLRWKDRDLEICLDRVEGLGEFLEIETMANEGDKTVAQQTILSLAAELQLTVPEPRSYLEMLLATDAA